MYFKHPKRTDPSITLIFFPLNGKISSKSIISGLIWLPKVPEIYTSKSS
jgi:hypothetical protein